MKQIEVKRNLSRLGFKGVEVYKFTSTFYHEGLFYEVTNSNVTDTESIESIINKCYQL